MMNLVLYIHFGICLFMCGLIWLVQLVHYPSFRFVDKKNWLEFEKFHIRYISWIVMPVMFGELITAVLLGLFFKDALSILNLCLFLLIWLSTITLSMPSHKKLSVKHDPREIEKLIKTNWPRTILWSLRSILLLVMIVPSLEGLKW